MLIPPRFHPPRRSSEGWSLSRLLCWTETRDRPQPALGRRLGLKRNRNTSRGPSVLFHPGLATAFSEVADAAHVAGAFLYGDDAARLQ